MNNKPWCNNMFSCTKRKKKKKKTNYFTKMKKEENREPNECNKAGGLVYDWHSETKMFNLTNMTTILSYWGS